MNRTMVSLFYKTIIAVILFFLLSTVAISGNIRGGFYLKLGPSFAKGKFQSGQNLMFPDDSTATNLYYHPAKMGAAFDMGFLAYIGPAFANERIRAGIDVTFLTFNFNPVTINDTMDGSKYQYWYIFAGEKIGPVITINPVDKLMLDLSYKLNAYLAFNRHIVDGSYTSEWGSNLFQNEISLGIRYKVVVVSFQYNFGKVIFNDLDNTKTSHYVENNTFRMLIGLKF
jgi:hypothetical protein